MSPRLPIRLLWILWFSSVRASVPLWLPIKTLICCHQPAHLVLLFDWDERYYSLSWHWYNTGFVFKTCNNDRSMAAICETKSVPYYVLVLWQYEGSDLSFMLITMLCVQSWLGVVNYKFIWCHWCCESVFDIMLRLIMYLGSPFHYLNMFSQLFAIVQMSLVKQKLLECILCNGKKLYLNC